MSNPFAPDPGLAAQLGLGQDLAPVPDRSGTPPTSGAAGDLSPDARWPTGATGLAPVPGTDIRAACAVIAGELTELPFVPALPDRGVGADPVGRDVALLVDLAAEVVPSGWRLTGRPGRDVQRARDLLAWDLDAAGDSFAGAPALVLGVRGPISLAASLELAGGERAITDPGAVRDLTESLADGVRTMLAELGRRLPGTQLCGYFDEPLLAACLSGQIPTASGFGTVRAVPAELLQAWLTTGLAALAVPAVTGIEIGPAWELARSAGATVVSCNWPEFTQQSAAVVDRWAGAVSEGAQLICQLGRPTAAAPSDRQSRQTPQSADGSGSFAATGTAVLRSWRHAADPEAARRQLLLAAPPVQQSDALASALAFARRLVEALGDPPASWTDNAG